jgi:superfamily II DNA or RNA helicase
LGAENTKIVGDAFEIFVEAYLATHHKLQVDTVWLVGRVPSDIRKQLNLPKDAKGIDGVFTTRTGSLVPYQVKFRSNRTYLTYTEIAPFLGLTERAADRIVFTNSNELAADVKNRDAMRTVRGIDFDDLTEDDFRAISGWLRKQPAPVHKLTPRAYQIEALAKIRETLTKSHRAHIVMACGTGKTLVALWAAEQVKPRTVLVLVPSLTLLQQTLDEWTRHTSWGDDFSYICVCSDPTVASKDVNDPITFHRSDADFRVDTDPNEVRRFIQRATTSVKVIFSTYQSSAVVSEGVRGFGPLDIAIFDEAHKTTGPKGGLFAHSLSDENIQIRKRLFFTATPRHYDIRRRDREGEFRIISMDDERVYGPRAYTLTFGSAARQGIICNYKIVISVVNGHEVNDFALKRGITLVKGDLIGARWVANQLAVERAIERTDAVRGITFHNRVSSAREFGADTSRGIQQWLPNFSVFHVNGTQSSSERKQLIRSFRHAKKALITNARCLTEGIDVPAVDMVAFIDPRHSKVDIAQATGRAMRKPRGSKKEFGYVVIPLHLHRQGGETLEEALERSDFSHVADVLNAMQEQDEDLVDIIRELQEAKGRGEIFNPNRLSEKIEVCGPSIELSTLRLNIFAEIADAIGVSWDEWYGGLQSYRKREGHCRVPARYEENGFRLGGWVDHQRQIRESLSEARRQRLDDIGFDWEPHDTYWEVGFDYLQRYHQREGNCIVPQTHKENGYGLGKWVSVQRLNQDKLSPKHRERLDEVRFVWDPLEAAWEEGYRHLTIYVKRMGHARVPQSHKENTFPLGPWISNLRAKKDKLSPQRRHRLDELGFDWDPLGTRWEEGFHHLKLYKEREGHCRVPVSYKEKDGFSLGEWVNNQRAKKDSLTEERQKRLNDIDFIWDPFDDDWETAFGHLKLYREREGHCRVPQSYKAEDGYRLGQWVGVQRQSKGSLPQGRLQRLDELGFVWHEREMAWEDGFLHLKQYEKREGHCRAPVSHKENDGFPLGQWVFGQRQSRGSLSDDRLRRLDELGFDWDPLATDWENAFDHLKRYKEREGHCRVPVAHEERGFPLGRWVNRQRTAKGTMPGERRKRLDEVGFVWKAR